MRPHHRKNLYLISILLVFSFLVITPSRSAGGTLWESTWVTTPITIDGIFGEWSGVGHAAVWFCNGSSQTFHADFYMQNNGSHLFLCLIWVTYSSDPLFFLQIMFNECTWCPVPGAWKGSWNNVFQIYFNSTYYQWYDCYVNEAGAIARDLDQDGSGAAVFHSAYFVIEAAIPLFCPLSDDLQVAAGQRLGIALSLIDNVNQSSEAQYYYPNETLTQYYTQPLQLASAPGNIGTPLAPLFVLAGLLISTAIGFYAKKRQYLSSP